MSTTSIRYDNRCMFFCGGVLFFQLLYPPPTKKQQIYFSFTVTSPSQDNEQSSSICTLGKNINKCFVIYKKNITKEKKPSSNYRRFQKSFFIIINLRNQHIMEESFMKKISLAAFYFGKHF